ncbi:glycosyltransferase family 4 protein [Mucilaginibacter sp. FT3.2]|uniref:glycosyltransferase family 4 protein n=1 Tax=Mucilaginibacter sp. FT3.2 TaxID=2723090 RepID=UPI0016152734|nr:glycosyltransferase family 4 protein [Mucilaginibacter sp. FT3.2]MBB6230159.1 glycosyltransferase involved in cell wall biosynthesis [Mucilaginibacter sp. FT3.2]
MKNEQFPVKINLCASGDVDNPKTWSGTPFNIFSELKRKNLVDTIFSLHESFIFKRGAKFLSLLYYFNNQDVFRGRLSRIVSRRIVLNSLRKSSSKNTLHFGTLGFSFAKMPDNQNHYIYIDSTWALRSTQTAFMGKYSKRLIEDAELLESNSFNVCKHIFTISEYVKKNLIEHYLIPEHKITVVGTGVGVIKPYTGIKNYNNGKILFVAKGRFEDKGGHLVINAFKKALESNPNLELTIVGQKSYAHLDIHPKIKTYGFIPLEELQSLFETHSLFLMPAFYEPWGLVYLEALICKMPIVGLNRNSFPELSNYGEFGFGIDTPSEDLLAETISYAFKNPDLLEKMGLAGQAYCLSNFTWEASVDVMIKKINSLNENAPVSI